MQLILRTDQSAGEHEIASAQSEEAGKNKSPTNDVKECTDAIIEHHERAPKSEPLRCKFAFHAHRQQVITQRTSDDRQFNAFFETINQNKTRNCF